jgi:phosphatidylglycerol:prolipoprotein diacylglycerol transferase
VLFVIVWTFSATPRPYMSVSGLFLLGYGTFRFIIEFVRVPDSHLGYLAFDWLTMGQVLSVPMILLGATMMAMAYRIQSGKKATA